MFLLCEKFKLRLKQQASANEGVNPVVHDNEKLPLSLYKVFKVVTNRHNNSNYRKYNAS